MINLKAKDSVADAVKDILQQEALKGQQHQIDKNKNKKIDAQDFAILRGEKKPEVKKEEVEQIDELKKSTVKSYLSKKMASLPGKNPKKDQESMMKAHHRVTGVKPTSEEVELDEREMTAGETAEKERIVKGMKKSLSGFKARYGERAKNVMYATATKQAMKEEEQVEEGWDDMLKAVKDRSGPQPSGGSGIKQGTRYGGSKQKDKPEQEDEKAEKKK